MKCTLLRTKQLREILAEMSLFLQRKGHRQRLRERERERERKREREREREWQRERERERGQVANGMC